MLDKDVLSSVAGEYESKRSKHKLGVAQMFIVFVKSTIGLAIFGYHEVYQKSGVWLGLFISAVFIYTVTHGCMRMVVFADEVQSAALETRYEVGNLFEIVESIEQASKRTAWMNWVTFVFSFFSAIGFMVAAFVAFNTIFVQEYGFTPVAASLGLLTLLALVFLFFVEPEKLWYLSIAALFIIIGLVLISSGYAIRELFVKGVQPRSVAIDYWQTSKSCGIVISCIELINHVFNLQRMMDPQLRVRFLGVGYSGQFFAGCLYCLPSLLLFLVFGSKLQSMSFLVVKEVPAVKALIAIFPIVSLYGMVAMTIFNIEMLEKIKLFQSWVRNERRELSSVKIYCVRVGFLCGVGLLASCFSDIRVVYANAGIFINSVIALVVPGYCAAIRQQSLKLRDSAHDRVFDKLLLVLGGGVVALYAGELLFK